MASASEEAPLSIKPRGETRPIVDVRQTYQSPTPDLARLERLKIRLVPEAQAAIDFVLTDSGLAATLVAAGNAHRPPVATLASALPTALRPHITADVVKKALGLAVKVRMARIGWEPADKGVRLGKAGAPFVTGATYRPSAPVTNADIGNHILDAMIRGLNSDQRAALIARLQDGHA